MGPSQGLHADVPLQSRCRAAEEALARVMHELATNAEQAPDISSPDLSHKENKPGNQLKVPVEVAVKGLGPTGEINIPTHMG